MTPPTIRWGILGCGDVTEVKSGPGFQKADGSALVAVMRRTGALAADYAARHGVPRWYDDADALLRDPEVDAVYVATPPSSHLDLTLRCAAAGKPVYVEKPMAMNVAECEAMVEACHSAGVPLFVAYYRRALPRFVKVREIVQGGAIGTVRCVEIRLDRPVRDAERDPATQPWRVQPEVAGGGHFVDLASHTLDFLDYVLGPIEEARGLAANQAGAYPAEDVVAGTFRFASGAYGTGLWCFSAFDEQDRVVITGDRGRVEFATFAHTPIRLTTAEGVETFSIPHPAHVQQPLIQTVVDALRGAGPCPSTGETALRTTRVMDLLLAEYYAR